MTYLKNQIICLNHDFLALLLLITFLLIFHPSFNKPKNNPMRSKLNGTKTMGAFKPFLSGVYKQPAITSSKLTMETLEEGVNMFKVNNKDTGTTPCSSVSIVNFEQEWSQDDY